VVGTNPNPTQEGPTTDNLKAPETLSNNRYAPHALRTRKEDEAGGSTEQDETSDPPTEKTDHKEKPLPEDTGTDQYENSNLT